MKSKGCCYYVVMNFCASAHTVDSSFSNQKEKQNKATRSGLAVSQLYCCMLVNLKYACGKLAKATCERCISLQQHNVS